MQLFYWNLVNFVELRKLNYKKKWIKNLKNQFFFKLKYLQKSLLFFTGWPSKFKLIISTTPIKQQTFSFLVARFSFKAILMSVEISSSGFSNLICSIRSSCISSTKFRTSVQIYWLFLFHIVVIRLWKLKCTLSFLLIRVQVISFIFSNKNYNYGCVWVHITKNASFCMAVMNAGFLYKVIISVSW